MKNCYSKRLQPNPEVYLEIQNSMTGMRALDAVCSATHLRFTREHPNLRIIAVLHPQYIWLIHYCIPAIAVTLRLIIPYLIGCTVTIPALPSHSLSWSFSTLFSDTTCEVGPGLGKTVVTPNWRPSWAKPL